MGDYVPGFVPRPTQAIQAYESRGSIRTYSLDARTDGKGQKPTAGLTGLPSHQQSEESFEAISAGQALHPSPPQGKLLVCL